MIRVEGRVGGDAVGQITDFVALTWAEEVNTVTGGEITLPAGSEAIDLLRLAPNSSDLVGIIITDTATGHHVPAFFVETVDGSADALTARFLVDTAILNDVPAFPDPANPYDPWSSVPHWVRSGDAVDETAQFVLVHGGPYSHPDFRLFDSVTIGASAGVTVYFHARMQPCLDVIRDTVAGAAVVNARIEQGQTRCFIRAPIDRTQVVFSPDLHTVKSWELRNRMPDANRFWAGGQGELTAREMVTSTMATGWWPRPRGRFLDRRNLTGPALQAAADEAAAWSGPSLTVTAANSDVLAYGRDYDLGDTVRAEIAGTEYTLPVTSVDSTVDEDGMPARSIVLGSALPTARPDLQLAKAILRNFGLQEHT